LMIPPPLNFLDRKWWQILEPNTAPQLTIRDNQELRSSHASFKWCPPTIGLTIKSFFWLITVVYLCTLKWGHSIIRCQLPFSICMVLFHLKMLPWNNLIEEYVPWNNFQYYSLIIFTFIFTNFLPPFSCK